MNPRIAAYETLLLCEKEEQFSNIAVNNGIKRYSFEGLDRDFYTRLVYGVVEKQLTLNYFIQQYTGKSVKRLDKSVAIILRLSLYQIKFLDKIPESAAVSEGVKLAARFASRAKSYINAILRKACNEDAVFPDKNDLVKYYSVFYSVSPDICELLIEQYGTDAEKILQGYQANPNICFQVNSSKHSAQSFLDAYQLNATTVDQLPFAVKMQEKISLSEMPFLASGEAFVQDIASQLCACVLSPCADSVVVDVCACPGGKSFSAANYMYADGIRSNRPVNGHIYAFDLHESKLPLIKNGAKALGFSLISAEVQNAAFGQSDLFGKADRVICDVPCSGLGVVAKKPEIRYKSIEEIHAIPDIQYRILCASVKYLKEDGILVYSTCTVNKNENEAIITRFLKEHPDYKTVDFSIGAFASKNGYLTLLPSNEHDGFFIAKLQKTK